MRYPALLFREIGWISMCLYTSILIFLYYAIYSSAIHVAVWYPSTPCSLDFHALLHRSPSLMVRQLNTFFFRIFMSCFISCLSLYECVFEREWLPPSSFFPTTFGCLSSLFPFCISALSRQFLLFLLAIHIYMCHCPFICICFWCERVCIFSITLNCAANIKIGKNARNAKEQWPKKQW